MTPQRRAVVAIIQEASEHVDAGTLLRLAREREPDLDRATVYRTIDLLKRLRLIDELELMGLRGDGHSYEVRTRRDHVHLACFECGGVEELSSMLFERLKREVLERSGFDAGICRLEMGGLCRTCKSKKKEAAVATA